MQIQIPRKDWTGNIADAIQDAVDGDTIVCHSEAMKQLGERAKRRMCPDKNITFDLTDEEAAKV